MTVQLPQTPSETCILQRTALMATKRLAQAVGQFMALMVVLQRHLWFNLADLRDTDRKLILKASVSPSGLFSDALETIIECFTEAQKHAKSMSQMMPRWAFQLQPERSHPSAMSEALPPEGGHSGNSPSFRARGKGEEVASTDKKR